MGLATYLICMRSCYDNHRISARNLPGATGVNLPEEEVDEHGECP